MPIVNVVDLGIVTVAHSFTAFKNSGASSPAGLADNVHEISSFLPTEAAAPKLAPRVATERKQERKRILNVVNPELQRLEHIVNLYDGRYEAVRSMTPHYTTRTCRFTGRGPK